MTSPGVENFPATSLIICSRNRPEMLEATVESILLGERLPTELLIVDQSDRCNKQLEHLKSRPDCTIRYLWSQSVGLSRANNIGIATAAHEVLIFTHDDVLVEPNWLEAIVRALLAGGRRSVITGQVRPTARQTADGFAPSTKVDETPTAYVGRIGEDVLYPMNMAMYRCAIEEVGNFDERLGPGTPFPGAEDNDLCFRLLEAGYEIFYVPEVIVYHRAWRSPQDYLPLLWGYACAQGAYYAKHLCWRDRYMVGRMSRSLKRHSRQALRKVWSKQFEAYSHALYATGLLYGAIRWMLTYRRVL